MDSPVLLHSMLLMIFACCPLLGYAQQTEAVTEKEEANKAVVRYITARGVNTGNVDAWDEVLAPGYVRHSQATTGMEELRGIEPMKPFLRAHFAAFPDWHEEIDLILADGDLVAYITTGTGTQTGSMGPFPPTGKTMEVVTFVVHRFEAGKVAETWVGWDNLAALMQLGHFPPGGDQMQPKKESTAPLETDADEAAKALARQWFEEVINKRNLDAIADIYTADYIHHGPEGAELRGHAAVRSFAAAILAASDDRHAVVDQQVIEGDLVVTRFTSSGHHTGPWQGMAPTGEVWTTEGIVISRIEDGKIAEDWEVIHISGM